MENENNNQEPAPSGKQTLLNGIGTGISHDLKSNIYGYSSLPDEDKELFRRGII